MKLYVYLLGFIAYALSVYSCKNENDELSETSLANISGIGCGIHIPNCRIFILSHLREPTLDGSM